MGINKKYIGKITDKNLDDWLHSLGFLYPINEKQLERFNKLYEDYDFKLKNTNVDIKSIVNGSLRYKQKRISLNLGNDVSNEIQNLKMVARKGQINLPQHIIDKMKKKHLNSDDKEQF